MRHISFLLSSLLFLYGLSSIHVFESPNMYAFFKWIHLLCNNSFSRFHRGLQKCTDNSPWMRSKSPIAKTAMVRLGWSIRHLFSQHRRQRSTIPQRRTTKKIHSRNLASKVTIEKWGAVFRSLSFCKAWKVHRTQLCLSASKLECQVLGAIPYHPTWPIDLEVFREGWCW